MTSIRTVNGFDVQVDAADLDLVAPYQWVVYDRGARCRVLYAETTGNSKRRLYMHRLVMGAVTGEEVDHVNGNGLDNRRANLRFVTRGMNLANSQPQMGRSSRFKGVCWHKVAGKWVAAICVNRRNRHLGLFLDEEDAARAYDAAAIAAWGEYARPNFAPEPVS